MLVGISCLSWLLMSSSSLIRLTYSGLCSPASWPALLVWEGPFRQP